MFESNAETFGILSFAVSYALWAVLPGPNLLVVVNVGLQGPRLATAATVAGVATGASLLAFAAAIGFGPLATAETVRVGATLIFALLLIYTGAGATSRAVAVTLPAQGAAMPTRVPHFGIGFLTGLTNPVSAIFFASSMMQLDVSPRGAASTAAPAIVFVVAATWFGIVGIGLSLRPVQRAYLRGRRGIDITAGLCLVVIGVLALAGLLKGTA